MAMEVITKTNAVKNTSNIKVAWLLVFFSCLFGCSSMTAVNHVPHNTADSARKLVIFFDGTANDEGSHTNVAKLHNLTNLQDSDTISTSYIRGVGTNGKIIGMAMGWGIGHDVREAYLFLAENYTESRGDEIYIFGFSRGAYAARILAAMLNVAGISNSIKMKPKNDRYSYIKDIYTAYKSKKSIPERRIDVREVINESPKSVRVEFMGLWDTVEALGVPDYDEDWELPNERYADQLCNINKAAHALALDDDRARIFTPILMTQDHLIKDCTDIKIDDVVDEVWFSGAHSDVGGGYKNTHIDGYSLNWMLQKISPYDLVPEGTAVYADFREDIHDPEAGLWGVIYKKLNRSLESYGKYTNYNNNRLKIHQSVFDRLSVKQRKNYEFNWLESKEFKDCFVKTPPGITYSLDSKCFAVIPYKL